MVRATKYKCNIGDAHGNWEIVSLPDRATASHRDKQYAMAKCSKCGQVKEVNIYNLMLGKTKGCMKCNQHGLIEGNERVHRVWRNMLNRCTNPKVKCYDNYGGRGIAVCEEWRAFPKFLKWAMSSGYGNELQIDRIDSNGNYEPGNCRWVTSKVNNRNRRSNTFVEAFGERKTIVEWAEDERSIGDQCLIAMRIRNKWEPEVAITRKPLRR